jgi:hypothetical protein
MDSKKMTETARNMLIKGMYATVFRFEAKHKKEKTFPARLRVLIHEAREVFVLFGHDPDGVAWTKPSAWGVSESDAGTAPPHK